MSAKFVIRRKEEYYQFHFEGEHENILLFSRLFRSLPLCKKGIEELVARAQSSEPLECLQDAGGHFLFSIRNKKGILLAHSASFYAASTRDYAVLQVRRGVYQAAIVEEGLAVKSVSAFG